MQKLNGGYSYVTCYKIPYDEISKIDIASCKEPRETLGSFYERQINKPTILTNGGFFNMSNGAPVFNLLDEGERKSYNDLYKWGIGIVNESGRIEYGSIDTGIYRDFISAYPVLVEDGKKSNITFAKEIDGCHPRTLLGYNNDAVFIAVVDGRRLSKPGMTLSQSASLMLNFGCTYAINLDGGGSSRMLYKGKTVNSPLENRQVDNVIAIYTKSDIVESENNNPASTSTDRIYNVKYGDSLWTIAQKEMGNGMHYTILAKYNNMQINDSIYAGNTLRIPYEYDIHRDNKSTPEIINKGTLYTVKPGDSLWVIAQKTLGNGARYNEIKSYNNLKSNYIYAGQVLKIPN